MTAISGRGIQAEKFPAWQTAIHHDYEALRKEAEIKQIKLHTIVSKIQFLLAEWVKEVHRASTALGLLIKHLVYKISHPDEIVHLFRKIAVKNTLEKVEQPTATAMEATETTQNDKGKGVRARREIAQGELVLQGWGELSHARTMHTIQVDTHTHIVPVEPFVWLNHSCDPNCGLLIRQGKLELYALRPIKRGEEITVDYATFEMQIDFMPNQCLCGTEKCRVRITGYKDLPDDLRKYYGKYIAPYLSAHRPFITP